MFDKFWYFKRQEQYAKEILLVQKEMFANENENVIVLKKGKLSHNSELDLTNMSIGITQNGNTAGASIYVPKAEKHVYKNKDKTRNIKFKE